MRQSGDIDTTWLSRFGLREFVAVDVETTGLDARTDRIIEVGAVRFRDGRATDEYRSFVSAGRSLDSFITELTGITDADLEGAPPFTEIAEPLSKFIGEAVIAGQNVDFDLQFLSAEGRRLREIASPFQFRQAGTLDTAMLGRIFWPELTRFSLSHLTREFGVKLLRAHRAVEDARACGEVLVAMLTKLPDRVWRDLANDLFELISSTTHRSRFLFAALVHECRDVAGPPSPAPSSETTDSSAPRGIDESIAAWFGADGLMETALSGFEYRPMQLAMAEHVAQALEQDQIALIEAPTGTGKSLAYLVPALLWTHAAEDRQVVISSHTRALQEQLFGKDAADIGRALKASVPAAVLKGRSNYLCRRRLKQLLRDARERLSDSDRIRLMNVLRWAWLTESGDVAEIGSFNDRTEPYLWSLVSSDAQACSGSACGSRKGDFHRLAMERAAAANLVFVNHALLMSDPNRFLLAASPNRKVIIDEAHWFERAVVSAMTMELSSGVLRNTLLRISDERAGRGLFTRLLRSNDDLPDSAQSEIQTLTDEITALFAAIRQVFSTLAESLQANAERTSRTTRVRFRAGDPVHKLITEALGPLGVQWREFSQGFASLLSTLSDLTGSQRPSSELLLEFRSTLDRLESIDQALSRAAEIDERNAVFWAEAGTGRVGPWCSIYSAPVSVGEIMEAEFWPKVDSAILTSATMTTSGGFHHLRDSLGLAAIEPERLLESQLAGPFDLERQMRLLAPIYLPDPKQQSHHLSATGDMLEAIAESVHRGTLILCTSLEAVDVLGKRLEPVARRAGRQLLTQRSAGAPSSLIRRFRKAKDAILIGAASFWEGIDVVGEALQLLVIVRLPFDVPTDPWIDARCEHLRNQERDPFQDFSLPSAILRLKQGIGRLIRHPEDRGVVIIADTRLIRSRFGRRIQDSLPTRIHAVQTPDELTEQVSEFFHTIAVPS